MNIGGCHFPLSVAIPDDINSSSGIKKRVNTLFFNLTLILVQLSQIGLKCFTSRGMP